MKKLKTVACGGFMMVASLRETIFVAEKENSNQRKILEHDTRYKDNSHANHRVRGK